MAELAAIYLGVPLLYRLDLIPCHKIIPLLLVCGWCLLVLLRDPAYDRRRLSLRRLPGWRSVLLRSALVALALVLLAVLLEGVELCSLPRRRPGLWLLILLLYPLWSAWPQELICRTFFFHRYRNILGDGPVGVLVNAALFAFLHIIYREWLVLALTFLAGLILARTYLRTRSLTTVTLEHAILGDLVFTLGLGHYFYLPLA